MKKIIVSVLVIISLINVSFGQSIEKAEVSLDTELVKMLDTISDEDQKYRLQIDEIAEKYGQQSAEMRAHWNLIRKSDSVNLIKVKKILDERGWLGSDVVGFEGNSTLFLVIQHADQKNQEKYLPMVREAVKKGNAQPSSLAMLEDRLALKQGKRQVYGSQIAMDMETSEYYVQPLEDPANVDKRRALVGLEPLKDYVSHWEIEWNVDEYIKKLPEIENKRNNEFETFRKMTFTIKPDQIGIQIEEGETQIFGIVLDNVNDGIIEMVTGFENGYAGICYSSGGKVIGVRSNQVTKDAVTDWISKANTVFNKSVIIDDIPMPEKNKIRFYFLTNEGTFFIEEELKNIEDKSSEWLPLFEQGVKVIKEIKKVVEEKE